MLQSVPEALPSLAPRRVRHRSIVMILVAALVTFALGPASVLGALPDAYHFDSKWGTPGSAPGQLWEPKDLVISGNVLYVMDAGDSNLRVNKFTLHGQFLQSWSTARYPNGIGLDRSGLLYLAEHYSNRIRKLRDDGSVVATFTGPYIDRPDDVAVDGDGNIFVAEYYNDRIVKLDSQANYLASLVGGGFMSVAVDHNGFVYAADERSNRIVKFSNSGTVLTTWGTRGSGPGQFNSPIGVEADGQGGIWVADRFNHRVQKFTDSGVFVTAIGTFGSGDGQFWSPHGVAIDRATGKIYVADVGNHRIQVFAPEPSDTTPPQITALASPEPNANGWNNSDVSVTWSVVDQESGIASSSGCEATAHTADTSGTTLTCSATNGAGLASSTSVTIKVDKTPPAVSISGPAVLLQGSSGSATVAASDALSGMAIDPSGALALDTSAVGARSVSVTATDKAGNSAGVSLSYTIWGVNGPFAPVLKNGHGTGQFKAGSTIPVKFQLTDGASLITNATGTVTIGLASVPFRWDASAQQDVANVKTAAATGALPITLIINGIGTTSIATVNLR